jgi:dethiobiotin synthetase
MADCRRLMRLVIVGAGTGVGKTHLSVVLAHALSCGGDSVAALKPIETGVRPGILSDAEELAAASTFHVKHPPPYRFSEPLSPHLTARKTGASINLKTVATWVDEAVCPWVLVETAGGLLSPLGPGITNLDLARALRPRVVLLVALDRLGVLHEIAACCLALRVLAPEFQNLAIVLQAPPAPDLSTGTNAAELAALAIAEHVFTVPRGGVTDPRVMAAAGSLAAYLRALS